MAVYFSMAKDTKVTPLFKEPKQTLYLKQWRKYRGGLTQGELAELAEMSESNISQLERGLQGYSQEGLEALARALKCNPGELLMVNPLVSDGIWSLWETAKPDQRKMIVDIAKTVLKTGT